jgi:hypothetical protein
MTYSKRPAVTTKPGWWKPPGGGIIEQAQDNAEGSIRTFVTSLGYREVKFK